MDNLYTRTIEQAALETSRSLNIREGVAPGATRTSYPWGRKGGRPRQDGRMRLLKIPARFPGI
jgi:hypothetical protein